MTKRNFGLDLIRAIAILAVVIGHGGLISEDLFASWPDIPIVDGVELFFVLSGFLIGGILIRDMEKVSVYKFGHLFRFWKRRWFRTLPNYYLILLVNIVVVYLGLNGDDPKYITWEFFFFLQNTFEGVIGFFWESWSLAIEEWFYILIPLSLFILYRFMNLRSAFAIVIATSLVLPLLYRLFWAPEALDEFWYTTYYKKPVFARLDAIIYGVLGAYWSKFHSSSWSKYRWPLFALGLIGLYSDHIFNTSWDTLYGRVFELSIIPLGALLILPVVTTLRTCDLKWFERPITYISKISYSMYLVNLGLVSQVIGHNVVRDSRAELMVWYLLYWFIVITLSGLIYKYYEKPMMDLRDRY